MAQRSRLRALQSLLAVVVAGGFVASAAALAHQGERGLLEVIKLEDGTVIQVEEFRGPGKASALPYLFTNVRVEVHCPNHKDFSVNTGRSVPEIRAAYGRGDRAWCGVAHLMRDSPNCTVDVRPYGSTYVAVTKPKTWLATDDSSRTCQLTLSESLSMPRLLAAVMGGFLFWNAGILSESTPFRLTGGTLGFMALSSIIVAFFLYRRVPHKGKLLAGSAIFGSSFLATVRYLFGVWLPSMHQVLRHPVTLSYMGLSGLAGLALTYYYNNTENRKVNTMLRVALQMLGLFSVYLSTSMPEASVALCVGLLGAKAHGFLQQHRSFRSALVSAKHNVQEQLANGKDVGPHPVAGAPAAHAAGRRLAAAAGRAFPGPAAVAAEAAGEKYGTPTIVVRPAAPETSPLIQRGLVLNEETGHLIGIGKPTYNRLVHSGYVVDEKAGTITPPPPSPDSPARSGRGKGSGRRRHTP